MDFWLLHETVFAALLQAHKNTPASPEALAAFVAAANGGAESLLSVSGGAGVIKVEGTLTPRPDWYAKYYGGGNTTYSAILAALNEAAQNPDVKNVELHISSPGGHTSGLFEAMDVIAEFPKPIEAKVHGAALSAAYGIAAATGKITATHKSNQLGSVGTAVSYLVWPEMVELANNASPYKRPDLTTEEGKAMVREQLDKIHAVFVEGITRGRRTTTATVNAKYGKGAIMLAEEALAAGMIDGIEAIKPKLTAVKSNSNKSTADAGTKGKKTMDLEQLKAEHPGVYNAAVEAGKKLGTDAERGRVKAHLTLGEASGAMDVATKAIKEGAELTPEIQAEYMAAGMNKRDIEARDTDAGKAKPADAAKPGEQAKGDLGDQVAAVLEQQMGISEKESA